MILFLIICVVVLSSLAYWRPRPRYGWGWFDRPLFFSHRRPRPMEGPYMGTRGGFDRPMSGHGGGFGGHGPGMGGHGPGMGGHGGPGGGGPRH